MSAIYSIYTSPNHPPVPGHLPTLIVTPHGRSSHVLYTYLHTNNNKENYLLTPSDAGDLCVAKLYPTQSSTGTASAPSVRCEASRNLRWTINNTGIQVGAPTYSYRVPGKDLTHCRVQLLLQNPVYKLTLPNPDQPSQDQPLFQVSKPSPHATWWTLFYFTYAGHLIPPKRIEFGKIQRNSPEAGGGTRVSITGKSDDEKAVWKTLGDANEDMVEWIVICAALVVLDNEIVTAATLAGINTGSLPPNFPTRPEPASSLPGHAPRTRTTSAPSSRDAQRARSPQAPPPMPSSVSASGHGQPSNHSGRHRQPLLEEISNSRASAPIPQPSHSHNKSLPNSSAYRAPPPEPFHPPAQPQLRPPSQSRHPYAAPAPLPSHAQYQSSLQPQKMPPVAHAQPQKMPPAAHAAHPPRSSYEAGRPVQAPPPTHRASSDPRYAQSAPQQLPSQYQQQQPYPGSQPSMQSQQQPRGGGSPSQPYRAGPPPPHHGSPNGRGGSPQQSHRMPPPPQQYRQPMPPPQQQQERHLVRHQLSDRPVERDPHFDDGGRHRPHSADPPRPQRSQLSASRSYPELPMPNQYSAMPPPHPPQQQQQQQQQQREREQGGRGREPLGLAPSGHQASQPREHSQCHQQTQQPHPQARQQYPLPQQGKPYQPLQSRPPQQPQQQQQRPPGPPRPPQQHAPPQQAPQRQPLEPWLAPKGKAQNSIPPPVAAPSKPAAPPASEKKAPEKKNKSFALFSPPLASTKN
ncbi:BQ2448_2610 [Microbotryum intermedium]|uniref:BQ2448_2610 protein n=1 Tax=Microbotryum intermedium TaxID=269621 RepID=A0A238F6V5_9BASI|nr:BQ2448_2610 [Microbotryum intermedium]